MFCRTLYCLLGAGLFLLSSFARGVDYYIQAMPLNAGMHMTLNGFPLTDENCRASLTNFVTPFLINGKNTLEVTYIPLAESDSFSKLTWALSTVPDLESISSPSRVDLLKGSISAKQTPIASLATDAITCVYGSIDKSRIIFQRHDSTCRWGARLRPDSAFAWLPAQLEYGRLSREIDNVSIHFMKSGTPVKVSFTGISLPTTGKPIDLTPELLSSGGQWIHETGFDQVLIEGEQDEAPSTEILAMSMPSFLTLPGLTQERKEFVLTVPQRRRWEDGKKFQTLSDADKAQLWEVIKALHGALERKNIPQLKELFKTKTEILTQTAHQDITKLEAQLQTFYQYLFERADFQLEPLQRGMLEFVLLNDQIVTVTSFERRNLIKSLPMKLEPADTVWTFTLSSYFAHIDGKWVIIW